MKHIIPCFIFSSLLAISAPAFANTAFIHLNDDSGVMTDMDRVPNLRMQLLTQFKELGNQRRKYAKAKFIVVSTSLARAVWYGQISDLSTNRGAEVLEKTKNNPKRCNQLAESFDAVKSSIMQLTLQGYTDIHISVFSSIISTPVPCHDVKITLPQLPAPVDWVASLAPYESVTSISFYGVNVHQYPIYVQSLLPLMQWAQKNGVHFSVHDIESTQDVLRYGIEGAEK